MAVYNLTNVTDSTDALQMTQAFNDLSHGFLGAFIFLTIVIVFFGTMALSTRQEMKVVIAATAWFATFYSLMLFLLGLVHEGFVTVSFVLSLLAIALLFVNRE